MESTVLFFRVNEFSNVVFSKFIAYNKMHKIVKDNIRKFVYSEKYSQFKQASRHTKTRRDTSWCIETLRDASRRALIAISAPQLAISAAISEGPKTRFSSICKNFRLSKWWKQKFWPCRDAHLLLYRKHANKLRRKYKKLWTIRLFSEVDITTKTSLTARTLKQKWNYK
jgi:hypothetical protein